MHVCFDVDGVLVEGFHANPAYRRYWNEHLQRDLGIDRKVLEDVFFAHHFKDVITGKVALHEAFRRASPQIAGLEGKIDDVIRYWHENDNILYPSTWDVIRRIRPLHDNIHVTTHQSHERAAYLWNDMDFRKTFKNMFHSARIGHMKDDIDYFRKVEELLGAASHSCLIVDDTPRVIQTAFSAGWKAFWMETPNHAPQLEAFITQELGLSHDH